jgi:hypothetical protein
VFVDCSDDYIVVSLRLLGKLTVKRLSRIGYYLVLNAIGNCEDQFLLESKCLNKDILVPAVSILNWSLQGRVKTNEPAVKFRHGRANLRKDMTLTRPKVAT